MWVGLLAAVALAATYLRCGLGFGSGDGGGDGDGDGGGPARALVGPARCAIRVASTGITVDGTPMERGNTVSVCKAASGADVVVTGDAREGDWKLLEAALRAGGVTDIRVRQPGSRGAAAPPP
jgi:hypothetical protein